MQQFFLSIDARERESWREAFPGLVLGRLDRGCSAPGVIWVLLPSGQRADAMVSRLRKSSGGCPIVVLADEPSEDDALAALAAGAAGYCNGHASPQVLLQVGMAVEHGGVWVGQGLMQRLLTSSARLLPAGRVGGASWRSKLTAREQQTAALLAQGASNKEIARQLDITERTVKSHVSAMLEKLAVRDRLQLSLIINGVEQPR